MKYLLTAIILLIGFSCPQSAKAQGVGSVNIESPFTMAATPGTYTSIGETVIIPSGVYVVDSVWNIYAKYVWISSNAFIVKNAGSGDTARVQFFNLGDYPGGVASPTYLDANYATIQGVDIVIQNPLNLVLSDMIGSSAGQDPADDLPGASILNITFGNFVFDVDYGDLVLNSVFNDTTSQNITMNNTSTTLTELWLDKYSNIYNYQPNRMIVTSNSIQGHVKKDLCDGGGFIFPVGIAEQDYTPAQVSFSTGLGGTIYVSVQDYAASASPESLSDGIDRTWNIYAGGCFVTRGTGLRPAAGSDGGDGNDPQFGTIVGGTIDVTLQHNTITDQPLFSETSHFVTQWSDTTPNTSGDVATSTTAWQSNNLGTGTTGNLSTTGTIAGSSMRTRAYTTFGGSAADAQSYFSKSSNPVQTLPVKLVSFAGKAEACTAILNWTTGEEKELEKFIAERSVDGIRYETVSTVPAHNAATGSSYSLKTGQTTGTAYYRLRMENKDGSYDYSSVIKVKTDCSDKKPISLWPNPATSQVTLQGVETGDKIRVYNCTGQLVQAAEIQGNIQRIDLKAFPAGVYMLHVISGAGTNTVLKFVKQ